MSGVTATGPPADEQPLVQDLRRGGESAFAALLEQYHQSMLRLAQYFVHDRAAAEEVVQDTWLGVLQGLDRFEGRSSLKTWIFRILTNRAHTHRQREARTVPFSALTAADDEADPAVDPDRFALPDAGRAGGHWVSFPRNWGELPEERFESRETLSKVRQAIESLPPAQRQVITLRDVEGWTSSEVREALEISEANQRVLLHRARSRVRRALELYLGQ